MLFPRAERYLARLPDGLASYPQCTARASVFRAFTESRSLRRFPWSEARPEVHDLLRTLLPAESWLSEVSLTATVLTMADHLKLSDDETVAWLQECSGKLLSGRGLRSLMTFESIEHFVQDAPKRWSELHRGTGFGIARREGGACVTLRFPPFLFDPLSLRGFGEVLRVALKLSHAPSSQVVMVQHGPRSSEYHLGWA